MSGQNIRSDLDETDIKHIRTVFDSRISALKTNESPAQLGLREASKCLTNSWGITTRTSNIYPDI